MKFLFMSVSVLFTMPSFAQTLDPIVFSSKQESKSSEITSSHVVYEVDELEDQSNTRLTDLLKRVPGTEISQTGIVGGQASVFIRGGEGKHSLILIDGVKFYDPTNNSRTVNLSILNTLDIEKIEVLKGAQSVLYGSDAIAGVINIITKKGKAKDSVKISTGYFDELSTENTFSLGDGLLYLNAYYQESRFESVVKGGSEKDFNSSKGFSLNHSIEKGKFEFESMLKFDDIFSEIDGFNNITFLEDDDKNAFGKNQHYFLKEKIIYKRSPDHKFIFDLSYNNFKRQDKYFSTVDYQVDEASGTVLEAELRSIKKVSDGSILFGINNVKETYTADTVSEVELSILDLFFNRNQKINQNIFEYGARSTSNDKFGNHLVYSLGAKRSLFENHNIGVSLKTGFKAPSVYEQKAPPNQYGPLGNEDIGPEKSKNLELNYGYQKNTISSGVSFFYNEVEDSITKETSKHYNNVSKIITKGAEFSFGKSSDKYHIGSNFIMVNHAHSEGKKLARRPNFSLATDYSRKFTDNHTLSVNWNWKGRRFDISGNELSPYDIFDLNYVFSKDDVKLIASLKNVFDRDYEIARGYTVLRKAFELSLQYNY